MHLQDTYAAEKSDVGAWTEIGYTAPTSTVFTYEGGDGTFSATAISALDGVTGAWTVTSTWLSADGVVKHIPAMPENAEKLTPNFTRIGTSS